MDSKDREIAELKALVAALTQRVAELELALAKAQKDSSTHWLTMCVGLLLKLILVKGE